MALDLNSLNPQQREAVTTTQGPLLVLAGAGSGKTRVITMRVAYLMERLGVAPESILALTFTNKAAREMAQRVGALAKGRGEKPVISTFHAFGVRFLRSTIHLVGYHADFVIYDQQDQLTVVKEILAHQEDGGLFTPANALFAMQAAKSRGITPQELLQRKDSPTDQLTGRLFQEYSRVLKGMNALDFEDILHLSLQIAEHHPLEAQRFFSRFKFVMVDEYQDTNLVQYRLLRHLASGHHNVCVVGDDDQSIYGWRGAEPENINQFIADHPQAVVIRLEENYRSTDTILQAANQVIANNTGRQEKKLKGNRGKGAGLVWLLAEDEKEEMEKVVTHLRLAKMRTGRPLSDFAILFRSNHQSRTVEEALRLEGIPYHLVGGTGFYERKEIKDAVAYLRVIHNPDDEVSLFRVLNFPRRNIGQTSQVKLAEYARHQNRKVIDILREAEDYQEFRGPVGQSMAHFARNIDRYRIRFLREPLAATIQSFYQEIGLHEAVAKERKDQKGKELAIGLIAEFEQAAVHFARANPQARLKEYLERIALFTRQEDEDEPPEKEVSLLTVHSAKGLEFPFVYLVGMADELFPHHRALEEGGEEEERRLAYVAITRAREQLVFSMAKARRRYAETIVQKPSRFLLEVSPGLFDGAVPHGEDHPEAAGKKAAMTQEARKRFFEQMRKL